MVITIFPDLLDTYAGLTNFMRICEIITLLGGRVILNCIFTDCICDFLTIRIFRQVIKCICPVAIFICFDFLFLDFFAISHQSDRDTVWSCTILVVIVGPCLRTTDIYCFRLMTIRQYKSRFGIATCRCFIIFDFIFFDSVFNGFAIFIDIQIIEACFPMIIGIQFNCLTGIFTICIKMYDNFCWSFTILVLCIIPFFFDRYTCFLNLMCIDQIIAFDF